MMDGIQGSPAMLSKIRSTTRGFFFPLWSVPIFLLALTILTYGLRALSLGFFWDDWPYLWFFHRFGPAGIVAAFTQDRPFLSFIYNTTLTLLGNSVQGWQAFAILARWLCSLGFWWALIQAWPRHSHKVTWAVVLFTIYPGFTQQWIAVIYGQAFFLFALQLFSIGLTMWLARRRRTLTRWALVIGTALALGMSAFTMFSTEYFYGLELLRPILLWLVIGEDVIPLPRRLAKTAAWWAPYLGLMIIFAIWRGLIHPFPASTLSQLVGISQSTLATTQHLTLTILEDLVEAALAAWGPPLQLAGFIEQTGAFAGLRFLSIIVFVGLLTVLYLARLGPAQINPDPSEPPHDRWSWGWQAMAVGLVLLLAAGWPFWLTGLPLRLGFPQDRYTLPLAPGVSLLLAGLIDLLGGREDLFPGFIRKAVMLGLLVGLAAGFHNNNALLYRQDWHNVRDFLWQLTWRAPFIKPGTLILADSLPFQFYEDDSLTAPLNWTYHPIGDSTQMDYMLSDLNVRQHSLPSLEPGFPVVTNFRAAQFQGSTSQVLALSYAPPGCVHVLDPVFDDEQYGLPERLQRALPLSGPQQWIQDSNPPAAPPADIFGEEPEHRWCYFYEKAELARQNQDWDTIYKLADQSIKEGFRPKDPSEYLPFIEGYVRLGLPDDAFELMNSAMQESQSLRPAICAVWRRAAESGIQFNETYRSALKDTFQCAIP